MVQVTLILTSRNKKYSLVSRLFPHRTIQMEEEIFFIWKMEELWNEAIKMWSSIRNSN